MLRSKIWRQSLNNISENSGLVRDLILKRKLRHLLHTCIFGWRKFHAVHFCVFKNTFKEKIHPKTVTVESRGRGGGVGSGWAWWGITLGNLRVLGRNYITNNPRCLIHILCLFCSISIRNLNSPLLYLNILQIYIFLFCCWCCCVFVLYREGVGRYFKYHMTNNYPNPYAIRLS